MDRAVVPESLRLLCWLTSTLWVALVIGEAEHWKRSRDPRSLPLVSAMLFLGYLAATALWVDGMLDHDVHALRWIIYVADAVVCSHFLIAGWLVRRRARRAALGEGGD
jgi:hypothetical protein